MGHETVRSSWLTTGGTGENRFSFVDFHSKCRTRLFQCQILGGEFDSIGDSELE